MNVTFDLKKYEHRRSKFTDEQLDHFHRKAVLRAAGGDEPRRQGAYPMLSPKQAESRHVVDPVRQVLAILRDFHPGPAWKEPEFVDRVMDILTTRYRELETIERMAEKPKETRQLGRGFDRKQIGDDDG